MMEKTKVLLADDHTILRQGLRMLLEAHESLAVIGEAENGREAVRMACDLHPDIVVMDIGMPLLNGTEATRQIRKEDDGINVLILSMYSDEEFVHRAMEAGASGYLVKQTASKDLVLAIQEVIRGKVFFSPSISSAVTDYYKAGLHQRSGHQKSLRPIELTSREREVLQLLAEGRSNKEVGTELSISVKTVEKHRQQIYKKLHLHDTAGITRYAISNGIVDQTIRGR